MNAAQLTAIELEPDNHRPPLAWLKADATPGAFAACFRCTHGVDVGIERLCAHPIVRDLREPLPVAVARAWGGGCGPNADRLQERASA